MKIALLFISIFIAISSCVEQKDSTKVSSNNSWDILETTKFTNGEILDSSYIKIEFGLYRRYNKFYKISSRNDTSSFYSFKIQTDSIGRTVEIDGVLINLGFLSWRDSLIIETKYGKEKIIKITTDSEGVSDANASTYYLTSGRPIILTWNSWAKYFTYECNDKDRTIIRALEKDTSGFFLWTKSNPPSPPST
jgi:hypothetical protein